jgi:tetrathionate reductase subunit B
MKDKKNKVRYGMVIDLRKCMGCNTCSVSCKVENDVPPGVFRSWVKVVEKGTYPNVRRSFLPVLCNNCENPICLQNCPVKATWQREDGIVIVDPHRCIGCKYCIASCPYNVRHINPIRKIVQKCTFCHHRVDAGLQPACVESCPPGARIFGDLNDPDSEISKLLVENATQVLKPEMGTDPRVFYIAADKAAMDPFAINS